MKAKDFPALYRSADESSIAAQSSYLLLIRLQFGLLVGAASLALWLGGSPLLNILYAIVVLASIALLSYLSVTKPEKDWYGCRALAESIKTSTWRYMMRADPFEDAPQLSDVKRRFAEFLQAILDANSHVRDPISRRPAGGEQITKGMDLVRAMSLVDRKNRYRIERISDQRSWYLGKVKTFRRQFRIWVTACVLVQIGAVLLVLLRIGYDDQWHLWPTDPLLVLASAIVGWIQIKKFNELASAYNLTAHEIGIIESQIDNVTKEGEFSDFVNEAERAFSREHTQWVARQTSGNL